MLNGDALMALGMGGGPQFYQAGGNVPFFEDLVGPAGIAPRRRNSR